jgi:UDP-MurNAc hydroxylase
MSITTTYIYSACIVTTTPDVRILHDPWFTEGIYDGSWFHFPIVQNPIASIGDVDLIYISHIHPDHYDSAFLKEYFEVYGKKKIIIADHNPNYLAGKMRGDGIECTILTNPLTIGNTEIQIMPHETGSIGDIDSAIVVKYNSSDKIHCVVNANDIIFDKNTRNTLKSISGNVDILLCSYTGAGPYPQTYFNLNDPSLKIEAENKKSAFFDRYLALTNVIKAKVNIPFAGKYILGGKLTPLNDFRGVADPTEVLEFDPLAFILSDNGGEINTETLTSSDIRRKPYDLADKLKRYDEVSKFKMDYERLINLDEIKQLPIKRLLSMAYYKAKLKSECESDYYFAIKVSDIEIAILNANKNTEDRVLFQSLDANIPKPYSIIEIDIRYLFGLLTYVYHWNNAEVGSQFNIIREPNEFNRNAQGFLNFLSI